MNRVVQCETCGGEGVCIEFRRFAGEYQAGEPIEVPCHDCGGESEWEEEAVCLFCGGPLAANGECPACTEPLTAEQLTETIGDPFKARKAA